EEGLPYCAPRSALQQGPPQRERLSSKALERPSPYVLLPLRGGSEARREGKPLPQTVVPHGMLSVHWDTLPSTRASALWKRTHAFYIQQSFSQVQVYTFWTDGQWHVGSVLKVEISPAWKPTRPCFKKGTLSR